MDWFQNERTIFNKYLLPTFFCKSLIPREFLVCVAQECECKGIIATTPIRLNLMLRLPLPPFYVSVHFTRVVARFLQVFILQDLARFVWFCIFCSPTFLPEG